MIVNKNNEHVVAPCSTIDLIKSTHALGVYSYLLSRKKTTILHLEKNFKEERVEIPKSIKYLQSVGLISRGVNMEIFVHLRPIDGFTQSEMFESPEEKKDSFNWDSLLLEINKNFSPKKFRVINQKAKNAFNARIKEGYSKMQILLTIEQVAQSEHHKGSNYQWVTPEFLARSKTVDAYGHKEVKVQKKYIPTV